MTDDHHHVSETSDRESRTADLLTKWAIVLIGAPVIIIATGYLVSMPVKLILSAVHFDATAHPVLALGIRLIIVVFWVASAAWLIRLVWPKSRGPLIAEPQDPATTDPTGFPRPSGSAPAA